MINARKNRLFERLFLSYTRRTMRRHFHGVHVGGLDNIGRLDRRVPIIVCSNHSSWWDAMLAFILARQVLHLEMFAMMEEKQLARYTFFRLIGAFSVVRESPRAAVESMRYAASLLKKPNVGLWIFPQGMMLPNDVRPLRFYQGAARIAQMVGRVQFLPLAHRYEFLMEQRAEAFTSIGEPWVVENPASPEQLTRELERRLTRELDRLCRRITSHDVGDFRQVLTGRASVNARYDKVHLIRGGGA
jgi:chlorobactene lauroyltransferase